MKPIVSCDRCFKDKGWNNPIGMLPQVLAYFVVRQVQCRFKPAQHDRCRGCTALGIECNWTNAPKPQLLPDIDYIKYLEAKVKEIEVHLKRTHPRIKTKQDIEGLLEQETERAYAMVPISTTSGTNPPAPLTDTTPSELDLTESPGLSQFIRHSRLADFGSPITADDPDENTIWEGTATSSHQCRYYGHSSTCVLSRDAVILRHDSYSLSRLSSGLSRGGCLRPEFWKPTNAEVKRLQPQHSHGQWEIERMMLELPSDDLMPILLNAYFENTFFPIVHRQLFEKQLCEGVHKREKSFLRLVLLVCANGARWCEDPRVLDERWPVSRSAGHRWLKQFDSWHMNLVATHQLSLWDAQILVLIGMFFCGSSATYGGWVTIGAAIRMMQDVGSHRRKAQKTLESELYKRCFWAMLLLDRLHSVHFGRNGAIADSDFDLDDVLEVDDELWSLEPGAPPPTQPPGVLPRLRVLNQAIALTRISGRCLQTVFALDQTKRLIGIDGPQGLARMINDINSRLLNWAHDMPLDLQLPDQILPNKQLSSSGFINMWASYYETVISINRPFISKTSDLSASCLAICREAAKGFVKMARVHCLRPESRSKFIPGLCYPAFSSAMVLAIDLILQDNPKAPSIEYPGSALGILEDAYDRQQIERDMKTCIQVLEDGEEYFQIAGKLRDLIKEFESSLRLGSSSPFGSPTLSGRIHSECPRPENVGNAPILSAQSSSYGVTPPTSHTAPRPIDRADPPFDVVSGYECANPYFLASGAASGFPPTGQLSGLCGMPFSSGIPYPEGFNSLGK